MIDARPDGAGTREEAPGSVGRRRGRRVSPIVIGLMLVLAAADYAVYIVLADRASQSSDEANIEGMEVVVSSRIVGQIASLAKEERAAVVKGEVLASLESTGFEAWERETVAGEELASQNMAQAQARLDEAEGDLEKATAQLQAKVIAQKQYDTKAAAKTSAETQLKIARALAGIAEAQAATAKANLEWAQIKSPIDGVVARKWSVAGITVQPAQSIYTLYNLDRLWVDADFRKGQLARIAIGDRAEIRVDAFPEKKLSGRVESVGVSGASLSTLLPPGNNTGNFTQVVRKRSVTISIDDLGAWKKESGKTLLPGMSATVRIWTGR
jgi:membrane fusion protein, multidrug efflux system